MLGLNNDMKTLSTTSIPNEIRAWQIQMLPAEPAYSVRRDSVVYYAHDVTEHLTGLVLLSCPPQSVVMVKKTIQLGKLVSQNEAAVFEEFGL
jgi:hypothetical protein